MAIVVFLPLLSTAHENEKRPKEEKDVNMAQANATNVFNLQDQEEIVIKMLQSTSMGQHFLGETKMEKFFIPNRTYVSHNKYVEEEEGGGGRAIVGDELPVLEGYKGARNKLCFRTPIGSKKHIK